MTIKEQFKQAYRFVRSLHSGYAELELTGSKFIDAISANAWKAALISYSERRNVDSFKFPFYIRQFGIYYDDTLKKVVRRNTEQ